MHESVGALGAAIWLLRESFRQRPNWRGRSKQPSNQGSGRSRRKNHVRNVAHIRRPVQFNVPQSVGPE